MPRSKPTISVIMSVYNHQDYVSDAIESIISQTFDDFEFIIINDGSTDSSLTVIQQYSKLDSRIIVIDHDNVGLTKSLNIGILKSSGQYIARQDADDISDSTRLEKQLNALKRHQLDLVSSRAIKRGKTVPNSFILDFNQVNSLRVGNIFIHGTFLVSRRVFDVQQYDEGYRYAQDFKFILDAFGNNFRIGYMLEPLYRLNVLEDSISNAKKDEQDKFVSSALKTFFGDDAYFLRINKCKKLFRSACRIAFIFYWIISNGSRSFTIIRPEGHK